MKIEEEILFNFGAKFKVVDFIAKDDIYKIVLEEL